MKFAIYFVALISVLGWQVNCEENQKVNAREVFDRWVNSVKTYEDFENGLLDHLPELVAQILFSSQDTTSTQSKFAEFVESMLFRENNDREQEKLEKMQEGKVVEIRKSFAEENSAPNEIPIEPSQKKIGRKDRMNPRLLRRIASCVRTVFSIFQ